MMNTLAVLLLSLCALTNGLFQARLLKMSTNSKQPMSGGMNNFKSKWNNQQDSPVSKNTNAPASNERELVFSSYVIYKSKAAVAVKCISPTFASKGTSGKSLSREGGLLFEFAASTGAPREYDWSKKVTFLLDVTECGTINYSSRNKYSCEFIHDPFMGQSNSGQIIKKLTYTPDKNNNGIFLGISVIDKQNSKESGTMLSVPLAWGEIEVITSIINYSIPKFLGFDLIWTNPGLPASDGNELNTMNPKAPQWKA